MIPDAIFTVTNGAAAITAVSPECKIFPGLAPKDQAGDYITYAELGGRNTVGGFTGGPEKSRWRFWCHSDRGNESPNYRQCRKLATALRKTLEAHTGTITTDDGPVCIDARYDDQRDTMQIPELMHGVEVDFILQFTE